MINPLLLPFNTKFNSIPFEEIKLEHFKPAFEQAIQIGKQEIEQIKQNVEAPNFRNTTEILERSGKLLDTISNIFFNLNSAETCDEMQALAQEISPLLSAYSNEILLDEILFNRIKTVYENKLSENLTDEQLMLLEETFTSYVDNGANLSEEAKEELKKINTELSILSLKFGENVLKDSNAFELFIDKETDLLGLPDDVKEAAKITAKSKGKENCWCFTLDYPSYIPFMQYSENRQLREKMFIAYGSRAFKNNQFNNENNLKSISELRLRKAKMLGFGSHAEKTLKRRMAENTEKVTKLLNELVKFAKPIAKNEISEITEHSKKLNGPEKLERWDFSFYSEKLKKEKFDIDDEILKPYFKLEKVLEGVFLTAQKLYGIKFIERTDIQKYHKDIVTYEVLDENDRHLALFYADFFPRKGKRNGAWMTSFKGQNKYDGIEQHPHVSIVCNFTKPTATKPSLLTFNELTTLFHEFGHALHGIFADGYYESLSGTSVFWDFVELPSQLMENWCYEKECLDLFARHYVTNEPIPIELVQKIKESANFLSAYQTIRQVSLGVLDMAWHDTKTAISESVGDFEKKIVEPFDLLPKVEGVNTSCSFSHIFQGGYSAGYYSYKWAEVLEADAYEYFKETGVFNNETARKFRENILSKGGSAHPMTLYKNFRGKEPSVEALLRKSGLINNQD